MPATGRRVRGRQLGRQLRDDVAQLLLRLVVQRDEGCVFSLVRGYLKLGQPSSVPRSVEVVLRAYRLVATREVQAGRKGVIRRVVAVLSGSGAGGVR